MRKLRWMTDCGFWDVDVSTPWTIDGVARPAHGYPLVMGMSRGSKLSRARQVDFLQRFMAMPFVPSFSKTLSFQRSLSLPLPSLLRDSWFATFLGQFNVQKFVSSMGKNLARKESDASSFWSNLSEKKLYALSLCSEWLLTPEDLLLLSLEANGGMMPPRKKAVFHHKFSNHNLTLETASPALFVDHLGNYWDVPLTMSMDLASAATSSGFRYHLYANQTSGSPKLAEGLPQSPVPSSLLPGLSAKCDFSFKKKFNIWRSQASKKKMAQPYDILLSNPHVSASALVGTVMAASHGERALREYCSSGFHARRENFSFLADVYASVCFSAQHGNFQKQFLDLTRFSSRVDIPSSVKLLSSAYRLTYDFIKGKSFKMESVQDICPSASVSFQQQIAGPFSFRIDAEVSIDPRRRRGVVLNVDDPVFAIEYALQLLGSAKAVAWYSLKQREFMVEVRFLKPEG